MLSWIKLSLFVALLSATLTFHFLTVAKYKEIEKLEATIALQEEQKKSLEKQGEIVLEAMKVEQEKNEQIQTLSAESERLRLSLQQRPSRPAPEVIYSQAPSSCTGRELYKEDGEFLVREAARADKLIAERDYWYKQYEQVRKKLNDE